MRIRHHVTVARRMQLISVDCRLDGYVTIVYYTARMSLLVHRHTEANSLGSLHWRPISTDLKQTTIIYLGRSSRTHAVT